MAKVPGHPGRSFRREVRCRAVGGGAKSSLFLQKHVPKVGTSINIDNGASDDFTIIEIFTEDRIGVLFTITYNLYRLGLSIHVAKISTNVDQAADVFYVTDQAGKKVEQRGSSRNYPSIHVSESRAAK